MFRRKGKSLLMAVVLTLLTTINTLYGSFGEAVRITEPSTLPEHGIYIDTQLSIRLNNGTIHAVGKRYTNERHAEIVYYKYNGLDGRQSRLIDDSPYFLHYNEEPVLELAPNGNLIFKYPAYYDRPGYSHLLKTFIVNDIWQTVHSSHINSDVKFRKPFISYNDYNEQYNIIIRQGVQGYDYHRFSNAEENLNGGNNDIHFFARDVVYGNVHSNTDIYMRAHSWPTFYGLVSTTGRIRVFPGGGTNYPRDQIFRGGLIENYYQIDYPAQAEAVRRYGAYPFGWEQRDDAIAFITVDGSNYSGMIGEIVTEDVNDPDFEWIEGVNQFTVYENYPPYGDIGEVIGVNRIPRKDTIWTPIEEGVLQNGSIFVPMELWISGNFEGKQTWASSHNIYLKGDLTYTNTVPGMSPDGYDSQGNQQYPVNETDYLGIISERSIYVQYGYHCSIDSVRYRPNADDIYMYGVYAALGRGENSWEDGVFSFQYQFPKGSTPNQTVNGQRYKNIDLHLFSYPTTALNPWPFGLDYPWYNPLWPEPGEIYGFPGLPRTPNPHDAPEIVKLRGNIRLFGSLAQRRVGYTRRSGNPDFDTGIWDIDNSLNPETPPQYGAPNPSIGPVGYEKDYRQDRRLEHTQPPHLDNIGLFHNRHSSFQLFTSDDAVRYDSLFTDTSIDFDDQLLVSTHKNMIAVLKGNTIILFEDDEYRKIDIELAEDEMIIDIVLNSRGIYLLTATDTGEMTSMTAKFIYIHSGQRHRLLNVRTGFNICDRHCTTLTGMFYGQFGEGRMTLISINVTVSEMNLSIHRDYMFAMRIILLHPGMLICFLIAQFQCCRKGISSTCS